MVRIYLENMVPSDVSNAVRKTLADLHERVFFCADVLCCIGGKGVSDGGHGNHAEGFDPHAG